MSFFFYFLFCLDVFVAIPEGSIIPVLESAPLWLSFPLAVKRVDELTLNLLYLEQEIREFYLQRRYKVSRIVTCFYDSCVQMWQRLVDQLEDSAHLPTVLQSLGCIAQNANPIFETREEEVIKFVVRNVLRRSIEQVYAISWDSLC
jgi:hypothetical protein